MTRVAGPGDRLDKRMHKSREQARFGVLSVRIMQRRQRKRAKLVSSCRRCDSIGGQGPTLVQRPTKRRAVGRGRGRRGDHQEKTEQAIDLVAPGAVKKS